MNFDTPALLELAERTARVTGEHALRHYDRRREVDRSLPHDVKLVLDRECQDVAEHCIHASAPDHAILGEEGSIERESEFTWIIDPIDGTLNFTHGLPHWGVSVAACHRDEGVVAGCIFLPMYEECYTVSADGPPFCNDRPVRLEASPRLSDSMVLTGIRIPPMPEAPDMTPLSLIMQHAQKTRLTGAACPDFCWVATGRADAYMDQGLYLWDIAVGRLLIERAGGTFLQTPYREANRWNVIAGPKSVAGELETLLGFPSPA